MNELVRVLKPGGILLAHDNDWGTFSINSSNQQVTEKLQSVWHDSFTQSWVGRYLAQYFTIAGLSEIRIYPKISIIKDFEIADRVYNLRLTVDRAVSENLLSSSDASTWIEELTAKDCFPTALLAYTVVGLRPS